MNHRVVGVECSTLAAKDFFADHSLQYTIKKIGADDEKVYEVH